MKHTIVALFLLFSISSFCQTGEKNFIDHNYIEVVGSAQMEIAPDLIYVNIVLSDKDNKNKKSIDELEKSMLSKLTEIGVDLKKDLSVRDFASNFQFNWISKTDIILTKEYQLIVHDASALQKLYIELQNLGISNVLIEKLDHSMITQYRKEVKVNAIKAAKSKAESLVVSINQTIGKALYIQELDNEYVVNPVHSRVGGVNVRGSSSFSRWDDQPSIPVIEFKKINIEYYILVRFELK